MKRILFIISYLTGGGAEHVARKNIECFYNHKEFEIAVLTADKQYIFDKKITKYLLNDFRNSNIKKLMNTIGIRKNYILTKKYLEDFKPDIIHIHDYVAFTPSMIKALNHYKLKNACKIILTHHTYNFICTNDSLYNYRTNTTCTECIGKFDTSILKKCCTGSFITSIGKYIQKNFFKKYFTNLIDLHISPSHFLKDKLLQANNKLNIYVVSNPCIEIVKDVNLEDKKNQIVFFGRVNKEKNITTFTKFFMESKCDMELIIIGDGNSSNELCQLINNNKNNNVCFINKFLDNDSLHKIIKNAKYLILPSVWYENSPVSIIEGINESLIPIVNNLGGMKEIINTFSVGHLIDMNKKNRVLELLSSLSKSYEKDKKHLVIAHKFLENFTKEHYYETMYNIYNDITSTSNLS